MSNNAYSRSIASAINRFLIEDDWHFNFEEDRGLFRFNLTLKGKLNQIRYIIDVDEEYFIVYTVCPLSVNQDDPDALIKMNEFLCRANYGLKQGNFEMDFRDGEIRYKIYVSCRGILPSSEMIKSAIYTNMHMFSRYGDGIVDCLFTDISAEDAVAKCEQ